VKHFQAKKLYGVIAEMESYFIDLRAAYACTINKSQGSTYDRVYIDLEDVRKCKNPNLLARLLYVGVSRARHQVFLTGSIG
jgi:ATP-dependent exoDNAse (exonuclease V) alpha subunit